MGDRCWKSLVAVAALLCSQSLGAAESSTVCGVASESCAATCKRFDSDDARFIACEKFCRTRAKDRGACEVERPALTVKPIEAAPQQELPIAQRESAEKTEAPNAPSVGEPSQQVAEPVDATPPAEAPVPPQASIAVVEQARAAEAAPPLNSAPTPASLPSKGAMVKELEKNAAMIAAIREGNLKAIRRLVQVQGLNPTYVYSYEFNPLTRQFDGKATRLRLIDIFNDTNVLRRDDQGLDKILSTFIELGLDVKATLSVPSASGAEVEQKTAWGPSLKAMEPARDRAARMRAFELALQSGLVPNSDFGDWLFAEFPQVCGRDRSKFSIEVFELLLKYLKPSMQDPLWREGQQGPETVADLLDRSFAPVQAKTAYERSQAVVLDDMWEQCTPLSRRISRFLAQNN
ncbi:MAG TPA: hypothetical protein VK629_17185 [Steroidobacteraceae bacterium]|nr:hypothetical protein [Steroidobacteraceae bacterium]